ncbi:hypothetical protein BJ742DRAFT_161669 [Cladochytrium replicatum]|nr:hypothetical protein BJ742DRAFT_161669 [Cladochytrium replicatum]
MVNNTTYSVEYTNAVAESNESKTAFWSKVIAEENGLRKLFAQQRDAPELNDPLVHLINPHADESLQLACKQWPEELAIPVVMPVKKRLAERERAIASKDEFLVNFRMFTEGMLFDLNWNNVFMAGGSVLACILPVPAPFNATASARRKYLREKYPASDIDLFIYGLAEDAAKAKMDEIYNSIADNLPHACIAFRTPAAVTIVSRYPYRHVQLVLRLYKSPAEVVMGFDVDACAVGFNGTDVMITRRAHLALVNQVNTIDISRRSPSYELRLSKYSERGFEVRVPQLDRKKVDPQIYERGFDKVNGLARLLLFESLRSMDERMNFKEVLRTRRLRPPHELAGRYSSNNYARQGDLKAQSVDSSDYASLFLPYGEEWNAESIRRQAYKKDKVLNNPFMMKKLRKTRHHQHPCFFGTMKEVFEDCCGQCPALPEDWDPEEDKLFVRGELKFIVDDPGRQEIGSFNPITDGDWTSDAYVHDLAEDVVRAIVADDVEKLKTIIKFPTIVPPEGSPTDPTVFDPNSRDWLGRTPLLLATFCTARRCIEYLLSPESDAKITPTLPDGRTALHLCAEYGLTDIAKLILKRNELNVLRMEEREKEKNAAAEKEKKSKQAENDQDNKDIDEDDYESITKDDISDEEEYHSVSEKDFEDEDAKEEKKKSDPEEVEDDVIDLNWADWDMKMTPLHYACFNGRVEMVTLLIDAGASYFKSVIVKQNLTYTPFNLALLCPFEDRGLDVIKELIKKNVPLTLINQAGENIVHMAVRLARMDIFEELQPMIAKSAALDALNFEAKSPLLIACEMGRVTCVEKLLELGALLSNKL